MDNSWVKLYRKIGENPIMQDDKACRVFLWLLIKVDKRTGLVTMGRFLAAEELKMNPNTFYSVLQRLEKKYKIITHRSNNRFTEVSLVNWAKYQTKDESKQAVNTKDSLEKDDLSTFPKNSTIDQHKATTQVVSLEKQRTSTQGVSQSSTTDQQQINTKQEYKNKEYKNNDIPLQRSEVSLYGNQDINGLILFLKEQQELTILDDTQEKNRRYAHLCIKKFGIEGTRAAIIAASQSKFWHPKG